MRLVETLIPYAAALAPHIDRLFVAGHVAARSLARTVMRELGLSGPGPLIDLRKLLLSPCGMTLEQVTALERYVAPELVSQALQGKVLEGWLREQNEGTGIQARFLPQLGSAIDRQE